MANDRYRPDGGTNESLDIPPPWREPAIPDRSRHATGRRRILTRQPPAILRQNRRSRSRRTGGRPGDRIAGRPVTVVIHPAGRPIRSSTIKVLRRPVESAQYLSMRYTARLAELGVTGSVGSRGDSFDNVLAETVNGLFKTELIKRRGPWRTVEQVELATLEWVDWWNQHRLHTALGV